MDGEHESGYRSYSRLPKEVRDWLEHLRPEEVVLMSADDAKSAREVVKFMQNFETMSRFVKWAVAGGIFILLSMSPILEALAKIRVWLSGVPKP